MAQETKECGHCRQEKPLTDFHKQRNLPSGHASYCKACKRAYTKAHPEYLQKQMPRIQARLAAERKRKHLARFKKAADYKASLPKRLHDAEYVPLTQGKFMAVPRQAFLTFMQHKWLCRKGRYGYRISGGVGIHAHHEVFRILGLPIPKPQVDHIDGDGLNNRLSNLRAATNLNNSHNNRRNVGAGVCHYGNRWLAEINFQNRYIELGRFPTREHAREIRELARAWLHGQFAPKVRSKFQALQGVDPPDLSTLKARKAFRKVLCDLYGILHPQKRAA
jgi:hypothetical protein